MLYKSVLSLLLVKFMILHYWSLVVCSRLHIRKSHRIKIAEKLPLELPHLFTVLNVTYVLFQWPERLKTYIV